MKQTFGDGRYEVCGVLGEGGFAQVLRAVDRSTGREVAVKLLRGGLASPERARFLREAQLLARFPHPDLVELLDHDLDAEPPFLVFPRMTGGEVGASGQPLDAQEVRRVGVRVARALAHLHQHGVVHRDVKPANILLDGEGAAYLADLGLGLSAAFPRDLTASGLVVGTPRYLAPEIFDRAEPSPQSDLYSLAVTLIQLRTGAAPGDSLLGPVFPPQLLAELRPRALRGVLLPALRPDPGSRPSSAAEFAAALAGLDLDEPRPPEAGAAPQADTDATRTLEPALPPVDVPAVPLAPAPLAPALPASVPNPDDPGPGKGPLVAARRRPRADRRRPWAVALFLGAGLGLGLGRCSRPVPAQPSVARRSLDLDAGQAIDVAHDAWTYRLEVVEAGPGARLVVAPRGPGPRWRRALPVAAGAAVRGEVAVRAAGLVLDLDDADATCLSHRGDLLDCRALVPSP